MSSITPSQFETRLEIEVSQIRLNKYVVLQTDLFQKSEKKNCGFMPEDFDLTLSNSPI